MRLYIFLNDKEGVLGCCTENSMVNLAGFLFVTKTHSSIQNHNALAYIKVVCTSNKHNGKTTEISDISPEIYVINNDFDNQNNESNFFLTNRAIKQINF